ncbi:MAG: hypothetical protein AAF999_18685 [Pseudomonadota bacterium]
MESSTLIAFLSIVTLGAVVVFALISKRRTEQRLKDESVPKSALAVDGPDQK